MTLLDVLYPRQWSSKEKFLTGDREGGEIIGFWMMIYASDKNLVHKVIDCIEKEDNGLQKISQMPPKVPNFYCRFEFKDETIFISMDDVDGYLDKMIAITKEQFLTTMFEYLSCIDSGLKNCNPFAFEYLAEGKVALDLYRNNGFQVYLKK